MWYASACHQFPSNLLSLFVLHYCQLYISLSPVVAQVADWQIYGPSHLRSHDYKQHIPTQNCHNEQQCTASLHSVSVRMDMAPL
jgi:hypothetical protein